MEGNVVCSRIEAVDMRGAKEMGRPMLRQSKFVIRTYHRIPVRCVLYYMGGEFLVKGPR